MTDYSETDEKVVPLDLKKKRSENDAFFFISIFILVIIFLQNIPSLTTIEDGFTFYFCIANQIKRFTKNPISASF